MISADRIVAAQHSDIAEAQALLSRRAFETTEAALAKVNRELRKTRRGSWTEAEALATREQLRAGIMSLALAHQQDLAAGLPPVMRAAQRRTAAYLKTLDRQYLGAVRPLRFDTLPWWERHAAELGQVRLRQFSPSFARYGADAVLAVEKAISVAVVTGQPWESARQGVWQATVGVVGDAQWKVDRILRTEVAAAYNGTTLAALHAEDQDGMPMLKKLVATFDQITALDSIAVHGQVRRVGEPFKDPKGRLYQAPPNRPNDREIVVGWRASWGESLPDYDASTAGKDPRFVPTPELPPAPPLKIKTPSPQPSGPQSSPQRAYLAGLTARRLVVASQIRAELMAPKLSLAVAMPDTLAALKREYVELRIQQAIAATAVRVVENDLLPVAKIKAGAWLDFGGLVFQVTSVAGGIRLRTAYGMAVLPLQPLPATLLTSRPKRVLRPRSQADVIAVLDAARRQGFLDAYGGSRGTPKRL